jgi:hypothetical protein
MFDKELALEILRQIDEKEITDQIDQALAKHYGFTDEESPLWSQSWTKPAMSSRA